MKRKGWKQIKLSWHCRIPLQWEIFHCHECFPDTAGDCSPAVWRIHEVFQGCATESCGLQSQTEKHESFRIPSRSSPSYSLSHKPPWLPAYSPGLRQTSSAPVPARGRGLVLSSTLNRVLAPAGRHRRLFRLMAVSLGSLSFVQFQSVYWECQPTLFPEHSFLLVFPKYTDCASPGTSEMKTVIITKMHYQNSTYVLCVDSVGNFVHTNFFNWELVKWRFIFGFGVEEISRGDAEVAFLVGFSQYDSFMFWNFIHNTKKCWQQ